MSSVSELQNWSKAVRGLAIDGAAEGMGTFLIWVFLAAFALISMSLFSVLT